MAQGGSVTLNGVTDAELIIILQHKDKAEKNIGFNPQQMQNMPQTPNQPPMYSNVTLGFSGAPGLAAVISVLQDLQKK